MGHNHALPSNPGNQWVVVIAGIAQERIAMGYGPLPFSNGGGVLCRPTTVGGTADGTRRSTVGILNMGTWAGTGGPLA